MARRILVAEDESLVAALFAELLAEAGYDVTLAPDGEQALERAAEAARTGGRHDALLTDLNMPNLCGEGLIRALRAREPGLPVVVVTGWPPPGGAGELRRRGGGHGPLALVLKPVDASQLLGALRRVTASAWTAAAD